jgi:hypothetical protein
MATPRTTDAELAAMLRELHDRDQIARVPRRYSRGVDRRDWQLVRSLFTDDAFVVGSRTSAPIEEYLVDLRQGVESFPTTMHFLGNQLVEVDGDQGFVETYGVAYHWKGAPAGVDDPGNLIVGVRYQDTMVRTDAGWLVSRRHVDPDWSVTNP